MTSVYDTTCAVCDERLTVAQSHPGPSMSSPLQNFPSVGQFLTQHGIVQVVSPDPKSHNLCCKCFALAQTCDELLSMFWSNVREFRVNRQRMNPTNVAAPPPPGNAAIPPPANLPNLVRYMGNGFPGPMAPPRPGFTAFPADPGPSHRNPGPQITTVRLPDAPSGPVPLPRMNLPAMQFLPVQNNNFVIYRPQPPAPEMNHPPISYTPDPDWKPDLDEPVVATCVYNGFPANTSNAIKPCEVRLERLPMDLDPTEDPLAAGPSNSSPGPSSVVPGPSNAGFGGNMAPVPYVIVPNNGVGLGDGSEVSERPFPPLFLTGDVSDDELNLT